jgi:hypothetical protein
VTAYAAPRYTGAHEGRPRGGQDVVPATLVVEDLQAAKAVVDALIYLYRLCAASGDD